MITSSPIDIEEKSPEEYRLVRGPHYTSVIQKRMPYVDVITKRTKDELISYLRELKDAIKTDEHQFGLLTTDSKKEFDILLVKVHNTVALQLNRIHAADKKRNYINAYINKIKDESFLARGATFKKRVSKKTFKKRVSKNTFKKRVRKSV